MEFYPASAQVPDEKRTERLLLRPLRATDVERDYEAVMSSTEMLRHWGQGNWPSNDFTLAENLDDLQRHERDHRERQAFTFTVLDPQAARCLGCVYIAAPWPQVGKVCEGASYPAAVRFWVRESELAHDLDQHLLVTLLEWFKAEWLFDCLVFAVSQGNERQARIFREANLVLRHTFDSPEGHRHWLVFTA